MLSSKLLARSRTFTHPLGVKLTTPILVPSFSSKGFPRGRDGDPSVADVLETTAEWLTETMLISAYDIHHGHIPSATKLPCTPELTFVDSGGYEAGLDDDLSAVVTKEHHPKPWAPENVKGVYAEWPERFAAVLVSYDHPARRVPLDPRIAYEEGQRERAARAGAQQATVVRAPVAPRGPRAPAGASVRSAPQVAHPAANDVPTDPASMAHFYAVTNALTRDEQALVVSIAQQLSDDERAAWFNELLPLSVPEAVATVRATLGQLVSQTPAPPSLTTSQPTSRQADQGSSAPSPASGPPSPTQANGQSRAS